MILSIVIVNYNVKYFLEQCLYSLKKSCEGLEAEVIVVDNQSSDGSLSYLSSRFPEVKFVPNKDNEGFSKACNRGAAIAGGKHILFLNPDTIVAEDSLHTCVNFLDAHPEVGAVGVKMIDGTGKFLKESKRAFPGPLTSLFKLFGLSKIFPRSKTFSRYYLGHLDANKNHEVDVLAGAFMMIKKEALVKTDFFDEDFFMYGEDIDLSYRIKKAGFKNYYIADTAIIHFKGESTKRGTLNYVRMFYTAMSIFVRKHYGGSRAWFFVASLHVAIWCRAAISALTKFIRWVGLPFIDALILLFSFWLVKEVWRELVKPDILYPDNLLFIALPVFTVIFLMAAYYAGLYNKRFRKVDLTRSMTIATLVLLAAYSLLPETYRFSRAVVFFGSLTGFLLISLLRKAMVKGGLLQKSIEYTEHPYLLIAAAPTDYIGIRNFLQKQNTAQSVIGRVALDEQMQDTVTTLKELNEVVTVLSAEEIVFVPGTTFGYKKIIAFITESKLSLRLRFHAPGSCSIIGSDSDTAAGDVIAHEKDFNLASSSKRRIKRLIDFVSALIFLLSFPIHIIGIRKPVCFFKNCLSVLIAHKTWIGYSHPSTSLPPLRKAVIRISHAKEDNEIDYWYAKNYEPSQDIRLIVKNYIHLGE